MTTFAQNKTTFTCGYNTSVKPNFCDFVYDNKYITDYGVKSKVKSIVDLVGLPQNFILVECSNVNNAYAFLSSRGERYIVIDNQWLTAIGSKNWFILGVIAHEIGHHLCGHTSVNKELTYAESQKQELEADKFAGFILQGLGATLDQALSSINTLVPNEEDDTYSTHPKRSRRLVAIKAGYNKSNPTTSETYSSTSAEEYFNLGWQVAEDPSVYTSSDALIKSLNYYLAALKINPNFLYALQNAGGVYQILGDKNTISATSSWDGAMYCYNKLLELDPYNVGAMNNIGQMYSTAGYRLNDYNSYLTAIKYFNACIQIKPSFGPAYLNRGIVYLNYGYAFHSPTIPQACSDFYNACQLGESKGCTHYYNACK